MGILPEYSRDIHGQLWFVESDRNRMRIYYKVKEIVHCSETKNQNLTILELYDYGRCLVLDGVIQTTELDACIYNEMLTHIPIMIHKNARSILVIGAGSCGNIKELIKYPSIECIDVVEIDREVVDVCIKEMPMIARNSISDERVSFHYMDGSAYMLDPALKGKYDIVLIDSSDPKGPSKVLFEQALYAQVFDVLGEDGIVVCQSESLLFYKNILSQVRLNLKSLFPIVETYYFPMPCFPGGLWSHTMASKRHCIEEAEPSLLPEDVRFIQKEKVKSYFDIPEAIRGGL